MESHHKEDFNLLQAISLLMHIGHTKGFFRGESYVAIRQDINFKLGQYRDYEQWSKDQQTKNKNP